MLIGGYGVFGGHLSQMLLAKGHVVYVAGRSQQKADAFCAAHGGIALQIDRSDLVQIGALLDRDAIDILIDASGPFQAYEQGYALARVALASEVHYIDLCDDATFSNGINTLDALALQIGHVCLSGASTVPAISSAIVETLVDGLEEVTLIETAIVPGNRAPRGRSVMQAILAQVGQPVTVWRGGAWREVRGWSGSIEIDLPGGLRRCASYIGAPDLALFPTHFKARSVRFRAGLELGLMHRTLALLGWAVSRGLLPRLDHFAGAFLFVANIMRGFGTDRGGMRVCVAGRDADTRPITRHWLLSIAGGQGPKIPAVPAALLVDQIAAGEIAPGARAVIAQTPLATYEAALHDLGATIEREEVTSGPVFEQVLGASWAQMPASFRAAHDVWDLHVLEGEASVERGSGFLSDLICALFRFPPATKKTDIRVEMERMGPVEIWRRSFGARRFQSVLTPAGAGRITERFGPFSFELALPLSDGAMQMQVVKGWFLGIPMPARFLPISQTREFEKDTRFNFDVALSLPIAGDLVRYRGWLVPERAPD